MFRKSVVFVCLLSLVLLCAPQCVSDTAKTTWVNRKAFYNAVYLRIDGGNNMEADLTIDPVDDSATQSNSNKLELVGRSGGNAYKPYLQFFTGNSGRESLSIMDTQGNALFWGLDQGLAGTEAVGTDLFEMQIGNSNYTGDKTATLVLNGSVSGYPGAGVWEVSATSNNTLNFLYGGTLKLQYDVTNDIFKYASTPSLSGSNNIATKGYVDNNDDDTIGWRQESDNYTFWRVDWGDAVGTTSGSYNLKESHNTYRGTVNASGNNIIEQEIRSYIQYITYDNSMKISLSWATEGPSTTGDITNVICGSRDNTDSTNTNGAFGITGSAGSFSFKVYDNDGSPTSADISSAIPTDGTPVRIEIQYEAGVEARCYINGTLEATISGGLPSGSTTFMGVGVRTQSEDGSSQITHHISDLVVKFNL